MEMIKILEGDHRNRIATERAESSEQETRTLNINKGRVDTSSLRELRRREFSSLVDFVSEEKKELLLFFLSRGRLPLIGGLLFFYLLRWELKAKFIHKILVLELLLPPCVGGIHGEDGLCVESGAENEKR